MQDGYINCYKKTPKYDNIVNILNELFRFMVKYTILIISV